MEGRGNFTASQKRLILYTGYSCIRYQSSSAGRPEGLCPARRPDQIRPRFQRHRQYGTSRDGVFARATGWPLPGQGRTARRLTLLASVAKFDLSLARLVVKPLRHLPCCRWLAHHRRTGRQVKQWSQWSYHRCHRITMNAEARYGTGQLRQQDQPEWSLLGGPRRSIG